MKVSVILPVYNGEKFVARGIRSVQNQIFKDWELLVVNDGSTDRTAEITQKIAAADPRVRCISKENSGIQRSLNRGLQEAAGEYIARIDDDDLWLDPKKLELQTAFLDGHPDHVLVGTGAIVQDESGRELFRYVPPEGDEAIRRKMLYRNCFIHSSVLFRLRPVQDLGGYPETKETLHIEDYALWLALGTKGKLANLPLYATGFTLRPGNISSRNKKEQFQKDLVIIKKYRHAYPGYVPALLAGRARLYVYGLFRLLPTPLRRGLMRWYKEV